MVGINRLDIHAMLSRYVQDINSLDASIDQCADDMFERLTPMFDAADRYTWLESVAKEVLLDPKRARCEWAPDMRTKWELPTLICSGPVGGHMTFTESIDVLRNKV